MFARKLHVWVKERRLAKYSVSYAMIRDQMLRMLREDPAWDTNCHFKATNSYVRGFCMRFNLGYRTPTHAAQQNTKSAATQCDQVLNYINELNRVCARLDVDAIINMDEVPTWVDDEHNRTIDEIGCRSVDVVNTGNDKKRFTSVLSIAASGDRLDTLIIFRKLKKVPPGKFPMDTIIAVSDSGTMDQSLMLLWIDKVLVPRLKRLNKDSALIMDSFSAHCTKVVREKLVKLRCTPVLIPGGYTSSLQPLDVSVNGPLKNAYRSLWAGWMSDSEPRYTPSGNRQKPGYGQLARFVSLAFARVGTADTIIHAFETSGLYHHTSELVVTEYVDALNERLHKIVFYDKSTTTFTHTVDLGWLHQLQL
jgi:hypothetical protein